MKRAIKNLLLVIALIVALLLCGVFTHVAMYYLELWLPWTAP
jgi:hypothetical protein